MTTFNQRDRAAFANEIRDLADRIEAGEIPVIGFVCVNAANGMVEMRLAVTGPEDPVQAAPEHVESVISRCGDDGLVGALKSVLHRMVASIGDA